MTSDNEEGQVWPPRASTPPPPLPSKEARQGSSSPLLDGPPKRPETPEPQTRNGRASRLSRSFATQLSLETPDRASFSGSISESLLWSAQSDRAEVPKGQAQLLEPSPVPYELSTATKQEEDWTARASTFKEAAQAQERTSMASVNGAQPRDPEQVMQAARIALRAVYKAEDALMGARKALLLVLPSESRSGVEASRPSSQRPERILYSPNRSSYSFLDRDSDDDFLYKRPTTKPEKKDRSSRRSSLQERRKSGVVKNETAEDSACASSTSNNDAFDPTTPASVSRRSSSRQASRLSSNYGGSPADLLLAPRPGVVAPSQDVRKAEPGVNAAMRSGGLGIGSAWKSTVATGSPREQISTQSRRKSRNSLMSYHAAVEMESASKAAKRQETLARAVRESLEHVEELSPTTTEAAATIDTVTVTGEAQPLHPVPATPVQHHLPTSVQVLHHPQHPQATPDSTLALAAMIGEEMAAHIAESRKTGPSSIASASSCPAMGPGPSAGENHKRASLSASLGMLSYPAKARQGGGDTTPDSQSTTSLSHPTPISQILNANEGISQSPENMTAASLNADLAKSHWSSITSSFSISDPNAGFQLRSDLRQLKSRSLTNANCLAADGSVTTSPANSSMVADHQSPSYGTSLCHRAISLVSVAEKKEEEDGEDKMDASQRPKRGSSSIWSLPSQRASLMPSARSSGRTEQGFGSNRRLTDLSLLQGIDSTQAASDSKQNKELLNDVPVVKLTRLSTQMLQHSVVSPPLHEGLNREEIGTAAVQARALAHGQNRERNNGPLSPQKSSSSPLPSQQHHHSTPDKSEDSSAMDLSGTFLKPREAPRPPEEGSQPSAPLPMLPDPLSPLSALSLAAQALQPAAAPSVSSRPASPPGVEHPVSISEKLFPAMQNVPLVALKMQRSAPIKPASLGRASTNANTKERNWFSRKLLKSRSTILQSTSAASTPPLAPSAPLTAKPRGAIAKVPTLLRQPISDEITERGKSEYQQRPLPEQSSKARMHSAEKQLRNDAGRDPFSAPSSPSPSTPSASVQEEAWRPTVLPPNVSIQVTTSKMISARDSGAPRSEGFAAPSASDVHGPEDQPHTETSSRTQQLAAERGLQLSLRGETLASGSTRGDVETSRMGSIGISQSNLSQIVLTPRGPRLGDGDGLPPPRRSVSMHEADLRALAAISPPATPAAPYPPHSTSTNMRPHSLATMARSEATSDSPLPPHSGLPFLEGEGLRSRLGSARSGYETATEGDILIDDAGYQTADISSLLSKASSGGTSPARSRGPSTPWRPQTPSRNGEATSQGQGSQLGTTPTAKGKQRRPSAAGSTASSFTSPVGGGPFSPHSLAHSRSHSSMISNTSSLARARRLNEQLRLLELQRDEIVAQSEASTDSHGGGAGRGQIQRSALQGLPLPRAGSVDVGIGPSVDIAAWARSQVAWPSRHAKGKEKEGSANRPPTSSSTTNDTSHDARSAILPPTSPSMSAFVWCTTADPPSIESFQLDGTARLEQPSTKTLPAGQADEDKLSTPQALNIWPSPTNRSLSPSTPWQQQQQQDTSDRKAPGSPASYRPVNETRTSTFLDPLTPLSDVTPSGPSSSPIVSSPGAQSYAGPAAFTGSLEGAGRGQQARDAGAATVPAENSWTNVGSDAEAVAWARSTNMGLPQGGPVRPPEASLTGPWTIPLHPSIQGRSDASLDPALASPSRPDWRATPPNLNVATPARGPGFPRHPPPQQGFDTPTSKPDPDRSETATLLSSPPSSRSIGEVSPWGDRGLFSTWAKEQSQRRGYD